LQIPNTLLPPPCGPAQEGRYGKPNDGRQGPHREALPILVLTLPTFDDEVAQSSVLRAAHTESPGGEPGLRGLCGVNRHSYHGPYLQ